MCITIAQLLSQTSLHLRLLVPGEPGALEKHIVWVHPTEVQDITFSEPGEILLTTGADFPLETLDDATEQKLLKRTRRNLGLPARYADADAAQREMWSSYVSQLHQAGVLAIGFGIAIKHPTVPRALIEAVTAQGMPLFEVPLSIPFAAVSKIVSQSVAEKHDDELRKVAVAQRQLIRALGTRRPLTSIIDCSANLIDGWSACVDMSGQVMAISNQTMHRQAADWAHRLKVKAAAAAVQGSIHMLFGVERGKDYCVCAVIDRTDGHEDIIGVVVASIPQPRESDTFLRSVAMMTADLLSTVVPRMSEWYHTVRELRSVALQQLAVGNYSFVAAAGPQLWRRLPDPPIMLVCLSGSSDDINSMYRRCAGEAFAVPSGQMLFGEYDGRLWLITSQHDWSKLQPVIDDSSLEYGCATASSWALTAECFGSAVENMHQRQSRQPGHVPYATSPLELIRPRLAVDYADSLLAPLQKSGDRDSEMLTDTLSELLSNTFNVSSTASKLKVHRHTVEHRLRKIEQLLGLDFSKEADRVKIWIACSFIRGSRRM